jgi:hypothetical protein
MIASPTLTSAAATTMIKNTNNCPSIPACDAAPSVAKLPHGAFLKTPPAKIHCIQHQLNTHEYNDRITAC